jgi:hypothetical protein
MKNQVTRRPINKARYGSADLAADRLLTNVSVAHFQDNMATFAHSAFATVPVNEPQGRYKVFNQADLTRPEAQVRKPNALFAEKTFGVAEQTFLCEEYAVETPLADEDRQTADSVLDDQAMARVLSQDLLLEREQRWTAAYLTPTSGVWSSHLTGGAEFTQWNDTSPDILGDIDEWKDTIKLTCGMDPNVAVITRDVWRVIKNDAGVIARIAGAAGPTPGNAALVTVANFAALIEMEEVIIQGAVFNSASEGAAYSGSFFQTERFGLFYKTPNPSILEPSAGYDFSWSPFDEVSSSGGLGAGIMKYRNELRAQDRFRGMTFNTFEVVTPGAGLVADDILV